MKRVKLYTSVAQVDGVTYSPGDVIELSDEDAQYLIDHGQGVETTDQVTDVAAREAAQGTDHAIRVDVQHGESQDIITVVPSDPDKKLPASQGGDDPDPAPAGDAQAAGDTAAEPAEPAGDEPQGSADDAPAEQAAPAAPADATAEPVAPAAPADDAGDAAGADAAAEPAADAAPADDAVADATAEPAADAAPADATAEPAEEPEPTDDATQKTTPKKRGRGRPRKTS